MCDLMSQMKNLVSQIDADGCCPPAPCCPPQNVCCYPDRPYVQCTMLCPPPCPVPTQPCPVKPLQLPCCKMPKLMTEAEALDKRIANFYNNYNIDWHPGPECCQPCPPPCEGCKKKGTTVDGKNPCCEDYRVKKQSCCPLPGCPTGFKPCKMRLTPPPCCDPAGLWCAQIQPCPPKPRKKVSYEYKPKCCTRPNCKHWKPKGPPCNYDGVCKASCFDHPPGIKPSGRNPYL